MEIKVGQRYLFKGCGRFIGEVVEVQGNKHNIKLVQDLGYCSDPYNSHLKVGFVWFGLTIDNSYWELLENQDKPQQ